MVYSLRSRFMVKAVGCRVTGVGCRVMKHHTFVPDESAYCAGTQI